MRTSSTSDKSTIVDDIAGYLGKMRGTRRANLRNGIVVMPTANVFWSWLGATIGIGLCAFLSTQYFETRDSILLIGSFGATAVLVYAAISSPLAQPRNLLGGHVLSAVVGVACFQILGDTWVASALAVSLAIAVMMVTDTVHPPGGATALIAVIGGDTIHNMGFLYPIFPVAVGAAILLIVALVVNNLSKSRKYPEYWL